MKLYLVISSFNDIITNSSTEILSIKTDETPETLKEIILNYAMSNDEYGMRYGVDPDSDVSISKVDHTKEFEELYGELSEEECVKLKDIVCKRYGLDPSKSGELYMIEIENHLDETIEFLQNTLGAL